MRPPAQNKTPVLDQQILQPMLAAALYVVKILGPHVTSVAQQVRHRRQEESGLPENKINIECLARVLRHHTDTDLPLEASRDVDVRTRLVQGWDQHDPLLHVSFGAMAREAGVNRLPADLLATAKPAIIETI